jgi:hypothetical protein
MKNYYDMVYCKQYKKNWVHTNLLSKQNFETGTERQSLMFTTAKNMEEHLLENLLLLPLLVSENHKKIT